tara:strand:+ start:6554 stop:6745 length:192 start_codon:yes stop_codon:yes gene_type:complete
MRISDITEWLNVSESAIYKWVKEERFPKPIKFGLEGTKGTKRMSARWTREDIEDWLERQKGMK